MKLNITLMKSPIACQPKQKATVQALGLRKVGQTVCQPDNAAIRGQIFAVKHMLKVEEVNEERRETPMKLHELQPAVGSTTAPKRLGRGVGSGLGKTSGKGHKGAKARSGGGKRPGFEGGQMPLYRRVPKKGFTNIFGTEYACVNVERLEIFNDGDVVTAQSLIDAGIIKKTLDGVKIMGNGELTKKLTVQASKFTASAKEKIEALGGKAEVI